MTELFLNILLYLTAGAMFASFIVFWLDFAPFYKIFKGKKMRK